MSFRFRPIDVSLAVDLVDSTRWAAKVAADSGGCWLWTGGSTSNNYGQVHLVDRMVLAHRVAWVAANRRDVPTGLTLDHLCRNPSCVNPDHLEPVTNRENSLRGESPAAMCARKTHCALGHRLGPDNVTPFEAKQGHRTCRECTRVYYRTYYAANREQIRARQQKRRAIRREMRGAA